MGILGQFKVIAQSLYTYKKMRNEKKKLTFFNLVKKVISNEKLRKSPSNVEKTSNLINQNHKNERKLLSKTNSLPMKMSLSDTNIYFQNPAINENFEKNLRNENKRRNKFTSLKVKKSENISNNEQRRNKFTSLKLKKTESSSNNEHSIKNSNSTYRKLSVKHLKKSTSSVILNQSLPNLNEESILDGVEQHESEIIVDCLDSDTFKMFEYENRGCDIEFIEMSIE